MMSILPMYRICPICKSKYSWNPSVGKILCPYCTGKEERKWPWKFPKK